LWQFLGSTRLALTLVLLLAVFFGAAAVGGREVLSTPWFATVLIAFTVNVTVCTVRRAARLFREDGRQGVTPAPAVAADPDRDKQLLATAVPVLAARGYKVALQPNEVVAEKHRFARWGPALLHLGFLIVLAGAVTGAVLRTEGRFRIVEGQAFFSPQGKYLNLRSGAWAANPSYTITVPADRGQWYCTDCH
jgi:cytochrome c biogenesis protein ResB